MTIENLLVLESESTDFPVDQRLLVHAEECLRFLPGRREAWRAQCSDRDILIKIFQPHIKQQRDAMREWLHGMKLMRLGHQVAKPLCYAKGTHGELCVIYEFIHHGVIVSDILHEIPVRELLSVLMDQHASWHDSGCFQKDNHLGNYMMSDGTMYALDAGSVECTDDPLGQHQRIANLALLAAQLPLSMQSQMVTMLPVYFSQSSASFDESQFTRLLEKAIHTATIKKRQRYRKKTRRSCSEFMVNKQAGSALYIRRDCPDIIKDAMETDLDVYFKGRELLKDGNACTVVEVNIGGRACILKRYNKKDLLYRLLHAGSTPRALKSWTNGHVLRAFGIPTPQPLACLLQKQCGLLHKAYLLMGKVSGPSLKKVTIEQATQHDPDLATQMSNRWHELETLWVTHGDMKASNLIISDEGILTLIDLDGMKYHHCEKTLNKGKRKDSTRFAKNWNKNQELANFFKRVTIA